MLLVAHDAVPEAEEEGRDLLVGYEATEVVSQDLEYLRPGRSRCC